MEGVMEWLLETLKQYGLAGLVILVLGYVVRVLWIENRALHTMIRDDLIAGNTKMEALIQKVNAAIESATSRPTLPSSGNGE